VFRGGETMLTTTQTVWWASPALQSKLRFRNAVCGNVSLQCVDDTA
jgi:hypothetical protein